ncbi:MAG: transposase [Deltaproteobacteria bacterium]|nr:transposase [Deltaproteobacteria bacterium]
MTIGIDLGDRHSHLGLLDDAGAVVEEGRLVTTPDAFRRRFASLPRARIALEVGTHSPWASALLAELGHAVLVANPRKLRLIFRNDSKNDRCDAEQLARVARMDPRLLHPIEHRGRQAAVDLAVLRSRDTLVTARTRLVNHVRGTLKAFGLRAKTCSTPSFDKQAPAAIPAELQPALAPLVTLIGELTTAIKGCDRTIAGHRTFKPPTPRRRAANLSLIPTMTSGEEEVGGGGGGVRGRTGSASDQAALSGPRNTSRRCQPAKASPTACLPSCGLRSRLPANGIILAEASASPDARVETSTLRPGEMPRTPRSKSL